MTSENKAITFKYVKWIVGVVTPVIAITSYAVAEYSTINNRISKIEESNTAIVTHFDAEEAVYDGFRQKISDTETKYAEISASLDGIKTMQQDILTRLSHK